MLSLPIINGSEGDDVSIHVHQRIGPSRPLRRQTPQSHYNTLFKQFLSGELQTTVELDEPVFNSGLDSDSESERDVPKQVFSGTKEPESSEETLYDIPNKRFAVDSLDSLDYSRTNNDDLDNEVVVDEVSAIAQPKIQKSSSVVTTKLSIWGWIALLSIIGVAIYVLDIIQMGKEISIRNALVPSSWMSDLRKRQDFLEETLTSTTEDTNRRFGLINNKLSSTQESLERIAESLKSLHVPNITKNHVLNETLVGVDELMTNLDMEKVKQEILDQLLVKLPVRYGTHDQKLHYTKDFRKFIEEMARNVHTYQPEMDQETLKQVVKDYLQDEIPSNPKNLIMDSVVDAINGQRIKVNYADYGLGARILGFLTNLNMDDTSYGSSLLHIASLKWLFNGNFNKQNANNVLLDDDSSFLVSNTLAIRLSHVVYLSDLIINIKALSSSPSKTVHQMGVYVKPKKLKYFKQLLPHKLPNLPIESNRYLKRFIPIQTCRLANGINKIKLPRSLTHLQIPIRDIFLTFDSPVEIINLRGFGLTEYEGEENVEIGKDDMIS